MNEENNRTELMEHLVATGLSGDTATSRANAVKHARLLAEDDPDKHLGLGRRGRDFEGVLSAVADLCGCSPDGSTTEGPGVITPESTMAGLEAMTERLRDAAERREKVLIATGHPTALTPWYARIAGALEARGAQVLAPLEDQRLDAPEGSRLGGGVKLWRFFDEVGIFCVGWRLVHTHESWPMDALLDASEPDLVLSDHGFAGAAAARGVPTIAITDVNDPAIAVGWQDGLFEAVVPLDDNLAPRHYLKLARHTVDALGVPAGS